MTLEQEYKEKTGKDAMTPQEEALQIMKDNNFNIDNLDDRWQKLAFTFYNIIVKASEDLASLTRRLEAAEKRIKTAEAIVTSLVTYNRPDGKIGYYIPFEIGDKIGEWRNSILAENSIIAKQEGKK